MLYICLTLFWICFNFVLSHVYCDFIWFYCVLKCFELIFYSFWHIWIDFELRLTTMFDIILSYVIIIIIMLYNFKFISNSFDFIWNSIGIHLECWFDVVKIVWNVMNFGVNLTEMMDSSLILDWMRENHLLSANGLSISESVLAASLVRFPMLPLERQARILPLTWKMWFRFW